MSYISQKTLTEVRSALYELLDSLEVDSSQDGYDSKVNTAVREIEEIIDSEKDASFDEGKEEGRSEYE